MRTTLTLDDDVAARLKSAVRTLRRPFSRCSTRRSVAASTRWTARGPPVGRFERRASNLGPSLVGSLDNVEEILSRVEGEGHG